MINNIMNFVEAILDSSTVEHPAVNRRVVGSNPTRGAMKNSGGNPMRQIVDYINDNVNVTRFVA
jgi:hypothetical protein